MCWKKWGVRIISIVKLTARHDDELFVWCAAPSRHLVDDDDVHWWLTVPLADANWHCPQWVQHAARGGTSIHKSIGFRHAPFYRLQFDGIFFLLFFQFSMTTFGRRLCLSWRLMKMLHMRKLYGHLFFFFKLLSVFPLSQVSTMTPVNQSVQHIHIKFSFPHKDYVEKWTDSVLFISTYFTK